MNEQLVVKTLPSSGHEADDERAIRAWNTLEGMAEGMVAAGILRGASTATLKQIERTARGLADAAAEILKER
ncbi:hypothetical protein [Streptomyces sp. NPDC058674]|uniref:hypothetical protein n=1 Tax=Streptomyces sp. NPDC058674 TaxID=3346592 RepID=UPI003659DFA0